MKEQPGLLVMRRRISLRRIAATFVAFLPLNGLRCFLYGRIGYNISQSRIGWGTVIAIHELEMSNASIGRHNKIVGPLRMKMANNSAIGSHNAIVCDFWTMDQDHHQFGYRRHLICAERATITNHHWFDVTDQIRIGAFTYIAGIGSQFWTHGFSSDNREIDIGADCYVGSGCIFTPGSGVSDRSIVGAGSVVTKKNTSPFCLLAGNPASIVRENYYWRSRTLIDPGVPPPFPKKIASSDE